MHAEVMIQLLAGTTESQASTASGTIGTRKLSTSKSDVPAPPSTSTGGGKASLQPKRTPVSEKEIEAILVRHLLIFTIQLILFLYCPLYFAIS